MSDLIAAAIGAVLTLGGLRFVVRLDTERYGRTNFRGRSVIAPGGIALVPAVFAGGFVAVFADDAITAVTMAGTGLVVGALGYVDDVYGDRGAGGLIGHARAFVKGTVTTGLLKAGGGAIAGLAAAALLGWRGPWGIAAGAVVALASNMANLFDLRPGRVIKLWVPVALWLGLASTIGSGRTVLAAVGAAVIAFFIAEMREAVMLGDTGAGILGAMLGVGAIAVLDRTGVLIVLGVLLGLTLLSERVRFTPVIEAVPPLRWLDQLGRRRD